MIRKKPDRDRQNAFPLENSIDELENLIADKSRIDHDDIPVLDEIVDPETYEEPDPAEPFIDWPETEDGNTEATAEQVLSQDQIELLVGNMDQRISGELDELVTILRNVIKDSILTEIKTQLDSRPQEKPADDSDSHEDD